MLFTLSSYSSVFDNCCNTRSMTCGPMGQRELAGI
jgi:hypothetical protein